MSEQFQLRAQKTDDRVAFDDFGFLRTEFRRLFSDERAMPIARPDCPAAVLSCPKT